MRDVTTHMTTEVAEALVQLAGGERDDRGRWVFPDDKWTWATDEALLWALPFIAENAELSRG